MKLTLVVPCYNEQDNIVPMSNAIEKTFSGLYDYEIVFVNDGSSDKTCKEIKEYRKTSEQNIKLVSFSRNFGKEAAIYAGLKESRGDYVAIIDADLQQDPEIVKGMVETLDNEPDFDCVAAFQDHRSEGKVLSFFKRCFYRVIDKMTGMKFQQGASDFRTMRRTMVDAVLSMNEYYRFSKGIFAWVGFETKFIPYTAGERLNGKTKWSFFKLFKYAINGIISFSTIPLKISAAVGIASSVVAIIYMIVVIIQKLCFEISVSGYATIVVLILFLGGLQLSSIGILGEYLGKNYVETKKRPIYIAKEVIDYKHNDNESEQ